MTAMTYFDNNKTKYDFDTWIIYQNDNLPLSVTFGDW